MNVLITGSSGFIANYLTQCLIDKNIIYGFDLEKSTNTILIHDIRKKIEVFDFAKRIDLIINLAAFIENQGTSQMNILIQIF